MSFKAVATVLNSDLRDGSEVAVLVALAHCLNDQTGKCCPSTATIAQIARRSENIVRKTLKDLEARGLLSSAQPAGGVRHFSLNLTPLQVSSGVTDLEGVTEVQGVTEVKPPPYRSGRGGVAEVKAPPLQICKPNREENKESNKETNKEVSAPRPRSSAFLPPEVASGEIPRDLFNDWMSIRKAKRAPLTETGWNAVKREAEKAGLPLARAVSLMVEHSWQGFKADWQEVRAEAARAQGKPEPRQGTLFAQGPPQEQGLIPLTEPERLAWGKYIELVQQGYDRCKWARWAIGKYPGGGLEQRARSILHKAGAAA